MQMHFFLHFFGLCLAFSLLLVSRSMDKFVSHAPFDGGGGGKCSYLHFFCIAFFSVSTCTPPLNIVDLHCSSCSARLLQ